MRSGSLLVVVLLGGIAHADPESARTLSTEAKALAASGDLVGAAGKFREAFAAEPRPEYMCNVGVAFHKAKDLPRAHRYLKQCVQLGAALDAGYLDNVRKVIAAAEAKLAEGDFTPVDFALEPTVASVAIAGGVPYDEPIVGSGRFWFPYGTYELTIDAAGFVAKTLPIEAATDAAISIRERLEPAPEVPDPLPPDDPPPPLPPAPAPSKTPAIVASIATGAVAITAGVIYLKARAYVGEAEDQTDVGEFNRLRDSAKTFQRTSWVVGGLAGVGAIASGILWYRATRSPARLEVSASASGTSVWLSGRF